ncbi:MAG: hypothetical protein ABH863_03845 [Candidatus Micrarchaeota archaeon]
MKQLSLYQIRDMATRSGRAVFSIQQLANLIQKPKPISTVYSSRLVKKGLAKRLLAGKIAFTDDDFVIASQLVEPAYVTASSALLFHGLISQVPRQIQCATASNTRKYPHLGISYHKIPVALYFGFDRVKRAGSYAFIATPGKALMDSIYLNLLPPDSIRELKDQVDGAELVDYVGRFKGKGKKKLERALL